jgi:hypothetical protein
MDRLIKQSGEAYNSLLHSYGDILKRFAELEKDHKDDLHNTVKNELVFLQQLIKRIDITKLKGHYNDSIMNDITSNIKTINTEIDYMNRKLLGIHYYKALLPNINKYIINVVPTLSSEEMKTYGADPKKLKKIFLSKILHPKNILAFQSKIKLMVLATLSDKMFASIFKGIMYSATIRKKLTPAESNKLTGHPSANKRADDEFQSFHNYKKQQQRSEKKANVKFRKKN